MPAFNGSNAYLSLVERWRRASLEVQAVAVPRWRGCRGWKTMSGKLKADTTNNYAYNKKLQPFADNTGILAQKTR